MDQALKVLKNNQVALYIIAYEAEKHIDQVLKRIPKDIVNRFAQIYLIDDSSKLEQPIASYLTVELDLPKETLWFVHRGTNNQFDAEDVSYDPSNGTTSAGDIYQFVGWK